MKIQCPFANSQQTPRFRNIPGINGIPFLGQLFPLIYDLPNFVNSYHVKFGPVFRVTAGTEKMVIVLGADLAKEVLIDKDKLFSTELGYERLQPLLGRGLLQYDFDEHRFQRRIFQKAFTSQALRGYVGIIATEIDDEVRNWGNIKNFRLYSNVKNLLLRTGLAVFYDIRETTKKNSQLADAFVDLLNGSLRIFDINFPGFRMHKALKGSKIIREYLGELLSVRRTGEGKDMLSYICKEKKENGEFFTEKEIIDHACFLLLAAHDTNSSLLHHLIYYLTLYPEWLDKIRSEVRGRSIFDLDYDALQKMEVTGWIVDEALRVNSATPAIMRKTLKSTILNGVAIPANTYLLLIPDFNHNAPEEWLHPNKFDPARFSRERCEHRRHDFNYIPFGGGVHKCIGMHFARMQAIQFVSHFVTQYDFKTPKAYKAKFEYLPLPKIRDELPLTLRRRTHSG